MIYIYLLPFIFIMINIARILINYVLFSDKNAFHFKIHLLHSFTYNGLFIPWDLVFIVDKYVFYILFRIFLPLKILSQFQQQHIVNLVGTIYTALFSFNMLELYSNVPYPVLWPLCHQLPQLTLLLFPPK